MSDTLTLESVRGGVRPFVAWVEQSRRPTADEAAEVRTHAAIPVFLLEQLWNAAREMMDRGVDLVVAEAQLRFRTPARFDDVLTLCVSVTRLGNTAITSHHRISRGEEMVVEGTLRHVVVDLATLTKTPIPDWIREGLAPWAVEEADRVA